MPAQTSVSCAVERRLRSRMTMNVADVRHAASKLARRPASSSALADLKEARRSKESLHEERHRHVTSCETCFKSGASF